MHSQNINRRNFLKATVAIALAPGTAVAANLKLTPRDSLIAEQRVLGGLMADNDAWKQVIDVVGESDFCRASHRQIYRHIMALFENDKPADPLTVAASLARSGNLKQAGGQAHINWLASEPGHALNIRRWAEIVSERAHMRNQETCPEMARRYIQS
jgi:replicative DNA helicase